VLEQLIGGIKDAEKRAEKIIADAENRAREIIDASQTEIDKINGSVLDAISRKIKPAPPPVVTLFTEDISIDKKALDDAKKLIMSEFNKRYLA